MGEGLRLNSITDETPVPKCCMARSVRKVAETSTQVLFSFCSLALIAERHIHKFNGYNTLNYAEIETVGT